MLSVSPSSDEFSRLLGQGYNRIPVTRRILADSDTPVSTFRKLGHQPYTFLFESVHGGEKWGRYSFIGLPARERIEVRGNQFSLFRNEDCIDQREVKDPLQAIEQYMSQYKVAELEGLPRFYGGLVGYFGYDTVRYIEPRLAESTPKDELGVPDILLMLCDELVVFDNLSGSLSLVVLATDDEKAYEAACQRIDQLEKQLHQFQEEVVVTPTKMLEESDFKSSYGEDEFKKSVEKIKEYVLAGDTMQVVISQRMSAPFDGDALDLYRALRYLNPSPYMYCLNLGDFHIVGSSPEILVRVEQGEVVVRPIAGTRRRGKTEEDDLFMEQDLLNDPKEIAEHLMLIDLGRNDVGRIAENGSVTVSDQMVVERYSHVMHIVSNVIAKIRPEKTAMDAIRATFPAGTLSGAPKIRAMEIIDEMEPVKRGVYGGAIGYLAWNGEMDTAIAIRTAVIKDKTLYVQAGAGVVADSKPELEWKETMNKSRALFAAAQMVARQLEPDHD